MWSHTSTEYSGIFSLKLHERNLSWVSKNKGKYPFQNRKILWAKPELPNLYSNNENLWCQKTLKIIGIKSELGEWIWADSVKYRLRSLYLIQIIQIFKTDSDRLKNLRVEWWSFTYWSERKDIFIEGAKVKDYCFSRSHWVGWVIMGWWSDTGFSSLQLLTEYPQFLTWVIVYLALCFPTSFILPSVVTTCITGSVNNYTFEKCIISMKLLGDHFFHPLEG